MIMAKKKLPLPQDPFASENAPTNPFPRADVTNPDREALGELVRKMSEGKGSPYVDPIVNNYRSRVREAQPGLKQGREMARAAWNMSPLTRDNSDFNPTDSFEQHDTVAFDRTKTSPLKRERREPVQDDIPLAKPTRKSYREPTEEIPQSPVRLRLGKQGHSAHSLLHATIEAMHMLGEHQGNNKRIIESMVNQ
jgi:hypothetical protein